MVQDLDLHLPKVNPSLIWIFKENITIRKIAKQHKFRYSSLSVKNSKYNKNYYEKKSVIILCDINFGHIGLIFPLMKYVYALPCHFVITN